MSIYRDGETDRHYRLEDAAEQCKYRDGLVCCGEQASWKDAHGAEPDTGTAAWSGGYGCALCGCAYEFVRIEDDDMC